MNLGTLEKQEGGGEENMRQENRDVTREEEPAVMGGRSQSATGGDSQSVINNHTPKDKAGKHKAAERKEEKRNMEEEDRETQTEGKVGEFKQRKNNMGVNSKIRQETDTKPQQPQVDIITIKTAKTV